MQKSPLVLGAMMFGTRIDEDTSFAILDRFVEAGGEWIDTADCYAFWASDTGFGGDSERLLGRWFAARPGVRDRVKLATKLGAEPTVKDGWPVRRAGPLRRGGQRCVRGQPRPPRDSTRSTCCGCTRRTARSPSKRRWMPSPAWSPPARSAGSGPPITPRGAWNARGRTRSAIGSRPIDALQHNATYLRPRPGTLPPGVVHRFGVLSDEQRDLATENDLEVWAYTPLLSGAYDNPAKSIPDVYDHPGNTARLEALDAAAAELGLQRGQVVLSWLVAHGIRPMLGGSKLEQLELALRGRRLRPAGRVARAPRRRRPRGGRGAAQRDAVIATRSSPRRTSGSACPSP